MKNIWKCGMVAGGFLAAAMMTSAGPFDNKAVMKAPAWVLHFDADALRSSTFGKMVMVELEKPEEQVKIEAAKNFLGFDPVKGLHGLTLYGASANPQDGVALVYGDFDAERLTMLASMGADHQTKTNLGHEIHSWVGNKKKDKDDKDDGDGRTFATIHAKKIVVFAQQEDRLIEAIKVLDGASPSLKEGEMFGKTDAKDGNFIQASARKLDVPGNDPQAAIFREAKHLALQVGELDGKLVARLSLQAENEDAAKKIAIIGQGLVALLSLQSDNPQSLKLAKALAITQEGNHAEVKISMPTQDLVDLIKSGADKKDKEEKAEKAEKDEKKDKSDKPEKP